MFANEKIMGFLTSVYDAFQKELQFFNQAMGRLMVECAKAYAKGPIFNEMAKQIGDDLLALEAKDVRLELKMEKSAFGFEK